MTDQSIKVNDLIKIKRNLMTEMVRLGFAPPVAQDFQDRYASTTQKAHAIWTEEVSKQTYVTIDLCCEIPIQCCEPA